MRANRWHVFCRVVDNYGDAGVCWRLARQLVAEHALDVTLWIDRLATLARFQPGIRTDADRQSSCGVDVRLLAESIDTTLADVVIEGFGCGLPLAYVDAMARAPAPPLWINLEYLSAEPWVDGAHRLASPQPRLPLERIFWFPGFTPRTGGLIRERGLLDARDAFVGNLREPDERALRVLLFCYPSRALPALFDAWSQGDEAIACSIPEGVATGALDEWLRGEVPGAGESVARGRLRFDVLPFTSQDAFDRTLWRADVNFVRGEDSFVRAQWGARAFVWQPYPQEANAHRVKMDAFLARYAANLAPQPARALTEFWQAFNDGDGARTAAAWAPFRAAIGALAAHGRSWAGTLSALQDLSAGLVGYARNRL
jgi:uncharacterized repeat protein (TIGR03837 family)